MLETSGRFWVYLYPHSHRKPAIFPPLRDMGCHLCPVQLALFLWIFHSVFASSRVMLTFRFAVVTYQIR
jgi:hypothetical protein